MTIRNIGLTFLEAKKFKIVAGLVLGEDLLPHRQLSFHCVLTLWKGRRRGELALCGVFCKGTNPSHEGPTLMTLSPPKGPPPHSITVELRISTHEFWQGTQTFSSQEGQC